MTMVLGKANNSLRKVSVCKMVVHFLGPYIPGIANAIHCEAQFQMGYPDLSMAYELLTVPIRQEPHPSATAIDFDGWHQVAQGAVTARPSV